MTSNKLKALCSVLLLALAGCGATPMLHVGNAIVNMGQGLPPEMENLNYAGTVAFDEDFVGRYNRLSKNVLYVDGIVEGTPEYLYRVARINLQHSDGNFIYKPGEFLFKAGAMVPDNLPLLKAGDIVEIRQTKTWRTMENFATTGEGNIVLRILCRKQDPGFDKCLKSAPHIGEYLGQGPTGTPFPASARSLGLKFTPRYRTDGSVRLDGVDTSASTISAPLAR